MFLLIVIIIFIKLLEGFELEIDTGFILRKTIEYHHNGIKRTINDLEEEKDIYLKILNDWAKELPTNEMSDYNN